jgi:hypothetical protein
MLVGVWDYQYGGARGRMWMRADGTYLSRHTSEESDRPTHCGRFYVENGWTIVLHEQGFCPENLRFDGGTRYEFRIDPARYANPKGFLHTQYGKQPTALTNRKILTP